METVILNRKEASDLLITWSTDINIAYQGLKHVANHMEDATTEKEQAVILLAIKALEKVCIEIQEFDTERL